LGNRSRNALSILRGLTPTIDLSNSTALVVTGKDVSVNNLVTGGDVDIDNGGCDGLPVK